MEYWAFLAVVSACFWALVVLLDKFVVDSEIDGVLANAGVHGLFNCLTISILAFWLGGVVLDLKVFVGGLVLAALYSLANFFWFSGAGREEVSRFAPVLSFDVVFISILSLIFLQESFSPVVYGGIGLTIAGCFLISLENPVKSFSRVKSKIGLVFALGSAFFFAVREVFFKHFISISDTWNLIFYFGIGGVILSTAMFLKSEEEISGNTGGIEHLALAGSLSGIALAIFYIAVSKGPVSLVSTITKTRFILVFLGATLISRIHPEIIHEPLQTRIIVQKLVAIVMIIFGVALTIIF